MCPFGYCTVDRASIKGRKSSVRAVYGVIAKEDSRGFANAYMTREIPYECETVPAIVIPSSRLKPHFAGHPYVREGSSTRNYSPQKQRTRICAHRITHRRGNWLRRRETPVVTSGSISIPIRWPTIRIASSRSRRRQVYLKHQPSRHGRWRSGEPA
jgi:hypothetical protein